MNHFLLFLLARELAPLLSGRRITALRRVDGLVSIELADRKQSDWLVLVRSNPGPFVWLDASDPLADTGERIMKRIEGARIAAAIEPPRHRVLRLPLEVEGEPRTLAFYLYGSAARMRIETADRIVESLDAEETGVPVPHTFGKASPALADVDAEGLASALAAGDVPHKAVAGLEADLAAAFTGKRGLDASAVIAFRDELLSGGPVTLAASGRPGRAAPWPPDRKPPKGASVFGPEESVRTVCARVGHALLPIMRDNIVSNAAAPFRKRRQARQKLLAGLERDAEAAADFEVDRTEADILAAFQSRVPPGATEVELPDLYNEGATRTIRLDPSLSVREQVEKRYKRAAKLERSREALARRVEEVRREIDDLDKLLSEVTDAGTPLRNALEAVERGRRRFGLRPQRGPAAARAPREKEYRRFNLEDGWIVLVGRGDKENDEITFQVARPDDIWMHAQQVPGSHVVLKHLGRPGNPPNRILEIAAGIAAHFSKARHAGIVPVIYTKRKYVRKFRGARRGEVTCEREKTIFTEPKLPE